MKKYKFMNRTIIYLLIFIAFPILLSSQNIRFFDINTSNYPTVSAKFYAFDTIGKKINDIQIQDMRIYENGIQRNINSIKCAGNAEEPFSIVLTMDASNSIYITEFLDLSKYGANLILNSMNFKTSECCITAFSSNNYYLQDFTSNKNKLNKSLENMVNGFSTDYDEALLYPAAGALEAVKKAKYKKVVIMFTDGKPTEVPKTSEIISLANALDVKMYFIVMNNSAPKHIQDIASSTGGGYFDNIYNNNQMETAVYSIGAMLNNAVCDLEWNSVYHCSDLQIQGKFQIDKFKYSTDFEYQIDGSQLANIEINPNTFYFSGLHISDVIDTTITIRAIGRDMNITNIKSNNTNAEIAPKAFLLKKNEVRKINLKYTCQNDSIPEIAVLELMESECGGKQIYIRNLPAVGNFSDTNSISLVFPNGKDKLVVGSDTTIIWQGCMPTDTVILDYSFDEGKSWNNITNQGTNFKYIWKNIPYPTSDKCLIKATVRNLNNNIPIVSEYKTFPIQPFKNKNKYVLSKDNSKIALYGYDTDNINNRTDSVRIYSLPEVRLLDVFGLPYEGTAYSFNEMSTKLASAYFDYNYTTGSSSRGIQIKDFINGNVDIYPGDTLHSFSGFAINKDFTICTYNTFDTIYFKRVADNYLISKSEIIPYSLLNNFYPQSVEFSNDNSRLYYLDATKIVAVEVATCKNIDVLDFHYSSGIIKYYPDTDMIYRLTNDFNSFNLIHASPLKIEKSKTFDKYTGIRTIARSPNCKYIVSKSGEFNCIAKFFDLNTLLECGSINDSDLHPKYLGIEAPFFSTDGNYLLGIDGSKGTICRWKLNKLALTNNSDVSDTLFSIVAPNIIARDIDLGKAIVKTSKDSVVTKFIINSGAYPIRIDSIRVKYANVFNAYGYNSSIKLSPGESLNCEFVFSPNKLGQFSDSIYIYTQSGIVASKIIGEGVEPTLNIVYKNIDFGDVHTYDIKDTTIAIIENITQFDVFIKSMKLLGSDFDQFTCSDYSGFKLSAGEKKELKLSFKPIRIGRTNSDLGIYYDATGSPATIRMAGRGIGGVVKIVSDSAYSGEKKSIKLNIDNLLPGSKKNIGDRISSTLVMNGTLLTPLDQTLIDRRSGDSIFVKFNKQIDTTKSSLTELDVIAGLGKVESTPIIISNIDFFDANGNILDYEVEIQNGSFKLLGICREGGTRLVNPNSLVEIKSITPNPTSSLLNIDFNLTETGYTEISIYNDLGEKVKNILGENISSPGEMNVKVDISELGSGRYNLILKSPTCTLYRSISLVK